MDPETLRGLVEGMYMKHLEGGFSPETHTFLDKNQELFVENFMQFVGHMSRAPSFDPQFLEFLFRLYMTGAATAFTVCATEARGG
jgi:hypothetical protein